MNLLKRPHATGHLVLAVGMACVLVACGGGGGGPVDTPPAWQTAQFLDATDAPARDADVAINAVGVGYAVWAQSEGARNVVFASRYRNGIWEPAQPVTSDVNASASDPQVAVLPDGDALVVWQHGVASARNIAFKRSVNGNWPNGATVLQGSLDDVGTIELAADASGNAVAIWDQELNAASSPAIHAAVFRQGLLEQQQAISSGATMAELADIAMDANGNALAVWTQFNAVKGFSTIRVRPFVAGGWQLNRELTPDETQGSEFPRIAVGPGGQAFVVSVSSANTRMEVRRARDFATDDWLSEVVSLGIASSVHSSAEVAVDLLGNATFIWIEEQADATTHVQSARFLAGGNGAQVIGPVEVDAGFVDRPQIAVDGTGRVMAVWSQEDANKKLNLLSSRLDPAIGKWGAPERVENGDGGTVSETSSLAMNASGQALAVWTHSITVSPTASINSVMGNVFK